MQERARLPLFTPQENLKLGLGLGLGSGLGLGLGLGENLKHPAQLPPPHQLATAPHLPLTEQLGILPLRPYQG